MQGINSAKWPLLREPGHTSGAQQAAAKKQLSPRLTAGNLERHGHLLHDGPEPGEGCKAAIVTPAVTLLHVGKVEIPLQAHGDPFILWDVLQIWQGKGIVRWG